MAYQMMNLHIYSAYSVWKTGKALRYLTSFFNTDAQTPVPVYLTAPFVGLLGVSEAAGRLPFILLGIGSIFILYLLMKELFDNETIALLSATVLSISPWHLHVTRTAYDTVFAMFFFLLGTYLFIRGLRKDKNILWSLIPFFLAFYSYHATKFVFIFLLPTLLVLSYKKLKEKKRTGLLFIVGYFLIIFSFLLSISATGVTRQDETLLSMQDERAVSTVNYERRYNDSPQILKTIFNNKPHILFM
jgi:4-amino-4-deoxy-L-arabinose transferase-like glycosyltransferase